MTNTAHVRRYVFLDFETLKRIKFKKLEKICDKIFLFVSADVESVPIDLVRDMQKMGNAIKWVEVNVTNPNDMNYHICFLMGKLHEKIGGDVEFAILSNDAAFDPLVNFINSTGRSCLRVRQSAALGNGNEMPPLSNDVPKPEPRVELPEDFGATLFGERMSETASVGLAAHATDQRLIDETARETVRRLIRSGNRPYTLATLRSYILLHNQELSQHGDVDKIIEKLEINQDIRVADGDIQYNF
jgi:hypothetical protein